jgi:hypothetical protein
MNDETLPMEFLHVSCRLALLLQNESQRVVAAIIVTKQFLGSHTVRQFDFGSRLRGGMTHPVL